MHWQKISFTRYLLYVPKKRLFLYNIHAWLSSNSKLTKLIVYFVRNNVPGFMVMNIPQDHSRRISRPSKTKRDAPEASAERMERICWATTDNTSMLIRLNSSKQPQAPVCQHSHTHVNLENMCGGTKPATTPNPKRSPNPKYHNSANFAGNIKNGANVATISLRKIENAVKLNNTTKIKTPQIKKCHKFKMQQIACFIPTFSFCLDVRGKICILKTQKTRK